MRIPDRFASTSSAVYILVAANLMASLVIWGSMLQSWIFGFGGNWWRFLFGLPSDFLYFLLRPWTLLTYMIAQASPLQLLFNMLWLVWFGRILTDSEGNGRLWTLYIGGGLAGGIAYLLASLLFNVDGSFLIGSSAAILSVMIYSTIRNPGLHVPLLLIGEVRLKWIAIFTVIITLLGATGVAAHCAHIAGMLFPFGLTAWSRARMRRPYRRRKAPKALNNEDILDNLLDKIRISGFDSLTDTEKKLLEKISQEIKDPE